MTFEEKLKHSTIVGSGYLEKGKDVKTTKSRIIGLLLTLVIAAYTVYSTIKKYQTVELASDTVNIADQALLIVSLIAVGLKVIFSIILASYKKSIYALNHDQTIRAIQTASNIVLLLLFIINMHNYYVILDIGNNWDVTKNPNDNLNALSLKDKDSTFFFVVTLAINVPLLLKVILFSFKHGGIFWLSFILVFLFPIFILKFIKNTKDVFYEFQNVSGHNDKYYLVNKRKIDIKHYIRDTKFEKFFTIAVIFIIIYVALKFCLLNLGLEDYIFIPIFLATAGFISNLIYFFDLRMNMHLDELSRKFSERIDSESV